MNLPVVIVDLKKFEENIKKIKSTCKGVSFIFPVKCCTNRRVLKIVCKNMDGFDISNNNEYQLIKKYQKNKLICSSGPLSYELKDKKNVNVAFNNINDWDKKHGIRINFNDNTNFQESHFGTPISLCNKEIKDSIKYLHFHNSDYKDKLKCEQIYEQIKSIVKQFSNLEILNIGGHLEDLTWEEGIGYLKKIREILPNNINVVTEIGDFLFKDCGVLYCQVIDSKIIDRKQIIILNFSQMANQRWVHPKLNKIYEGTFTTTFYGNSCCEVDTYLANIKCKEMKKGEELVFNNISTYGYQWNNNFNGVPKIKYIFK